MKLVLKNGIKPKGMVTLPPSKSEAIRAALLLALSGEAPEKAVAGFDAPFCGDVENALAAARELSDVYAGESAALLRFAIPVQAALFGRISVRADARLIKRGVEEAEECLGISLAPDENGLIRTEAHLTASRFLIDCSRSRQFLSGLLIALPLLDRECEIIVKNGLVSKPYAEITLRFVRLFGGRIEETETGFLTRPSVYRAPERIPVTGDASYAAVFEAMNALGGQVEITGKGEGSLQPDAAFPALCELADISVTDCPDLAPLLAAAACAKTGDTMIHGTARLRTKESDREAGTVELIRSLGGSAEAGGGFITVHGTGSLSGGECDIHGDHRLAFAAAVMALVCESPVVFEGAECAYKSAPGFIEDLKKLDLTD